MREIILINITGQDKPGLTSSLTQILAQYEVAILDIGQAVIHDYLSLGILIEIPSAAGPRNTGRNAVSSPCWAAN